MKTLRNKILLGAIGICIALATAYMTAVSLVIHQQNLEQSSASLLKAAGIVRDGLGRRESDLLSASRELASQKNLGSTVWYLTQYSRSDLDRDTLVNTFEQLAQDTFRIGLVARAGRVAIYNAAGELISFSLLEGDEKRVGYVDRPSPGIFRTLILHPGEELNWKKTRSSKIVAGVEEKSAVPTREDVRYVEVDGALSIEARVPIFGETFDPATGAPERRKLGYVSMVQPIGMDFSAQFSKLTSFAINIFLPGGNGFGSLKDYRKPEFGQGGKTGKNGEILGIARTGGKDYYQCLMPLLHGEKVQGYIALLEPTETVTRNAWEMIRILWAIAAVSLVFILPLSWYFATSISRPIGTLTRIIRRFASGREADRDLAALEKGRNDELGELTRSFLAMRDAVEQKIAQINELNASLEARIEERTAELAARESESRTLIENSPDSIVRYDRDCRRIYANPAFAAMAEVEKEMLLGRTPSEYPGGPDSAVYERRIREVFATGKDTQFELRWPDRNGREICSHVRLTAEYDRSGKVATVLGIGRDITERMEFEQVIWMQANFDSLTRLPNRQMFHDRLEQEAKISNRTGNPMALLLIDLDRFKEVNDTLGHDQGDLLLIEAAKRISSCIREADTVARLGGDEFTVLLPEILHVSGVERIAQQIIERLGEPFALGSEEVHVSASIGISMYPDDATDLDILFKNADQAMYAAKGAGRNRFCYFTPAMQEMAQNRLLIANELRTALASEQFRVYYQPIVELPGGKIRKAEALLRWMHPSRGMVNPSGFISIAEESRLILSIGDWVFMEAVRQAKIWRDVLNEPVQISVNKSPLQITQKDRFSWSEYLHQEGLEARHISVEITEGLLLNPSEEVNEKLFRMRNAGIELAIDDFGTGHSSLSYLKTFDIDLLKIDQSYVSHIDTDENDLAICQAIIAMAHKLGLGVIAEGVENSAQQELLIDAGCDYAQGFLYSPPLPPMEFERLMGI